MKENKSDMDICMEYWDALSKYWVARAMADYISGSTCGSSILDFTFSPQPSWVGKAINGFHETIKGFLYADWPCGNPINSAYIETPLYMRNVFPLLRANGMARTLSKYERQELQLETGTMEMYSNIYIKKYGMEQRLAFRK